MLAPSALVQFMAPAHRDAGMSGSSLGHGRHHHLLLAGTELGDEAAPGGPGHPGEPGCGAGLLRLRPRCLPASGEAAEPEERLPAAAEGGKREVSPRAPATPWGGDFGGGFLVQARPRGDLLSAGGHERTLPASLLPRRQTSGSSLQLTR